MFQTTSKTFFDNTKQQAMISKQFNKTSFDKKFIQDQRRKTASEAVMGSSSQGFAYTNQLNNNTKNDFNNLFKFR